MYATSRESIVDDLKGLLKGEVWFDDLSRALYSTDASIFEVRPLGVVAPRDEEDVRILVRYAAEHGVPLIPRGAGSGLAGEALGAGIILDLSQHFRSILEIGCDSVRLQPGVVLRHLNEQLALIGRRFAPDPASGGHCTIGGMLATNASGARALRHGYTRAHVEALRLVVDSGDVVSAKRLAYANLPSRWPYRQRQWHWNGECERWQEIVQQVADLLERHDEWIQTCQPRTPFNRCGYLLHDILQPNMLDLPRLLVGSEGTLGIFTEATLRTVPLPAERALALIGFGSLDAALRAAQRALPTCPAVCDLLDRRLLTLARTNDDLVAERIPAAEALLFLEYEADVAGEARDAVRDVVQRLRRADSAFLFDSQAVEPREIERLWHLREASLPALYGMRGGVQPIPFVEDVGLPVGEVSAFLHRVQETLQRHETTASFLIHAGTGQVHMRPFLDLQRSEDVSKLWAIAEEVHRLVLDMGGTVSTQHGTGLARTPWVARQYGRLYAVFRELKTIFDPRRLFNPGKIVGPDPGMPAWPLRRPGASGHWRSAGEERQTAVSLEVVPPAAEPAREVATEETAVPLHLHWSSPDTLRAEILNCNGCGQCRTEAAAERMCPLFRATRLEAATPRAKANLLRFLFDAATDARLRTANEVREVANLCVNCKMCALECPAHVNIPKLMLELKAAHMAEHGLDRSDWVLARTEHFAALGSSFAVLANIGLGSHTVRWLLEKLFGVSRRRRLPAFASRDFLSRAARRGWTNRARLRPPCVVYFVDIFANYNDPLIAEATVAVLRHNGIEVYVPPRQYGCGMAPLAYGDVETAREIAQRNLRLLAELAREGYAIVCSEPTAALMLRHDYLDLLDDPDAQLVAEHTVELTTFLWDLHRQGKLRGDFTQRLDMTIGHHIPCHVKALGQPPAGPALLSLIPGLRSHTIDVSCSGMAGTYGLKAENYERSLQAGQPMLALLRQLEIRHGSTECSSCRLQMEEGSRKRTLHPVQYLALAYGLLPDMARRLQEPIRELILG